MGCLRVESDGSHYSLWLQLLLGLFLRHRLWRQQVVISRVAITLAIAGIVGVTSVGPRTDPSCRKSERT